MSDGWEPAAKPPEPGVEIPLSGDGPLAIRDDRAGTASQPNWRKVVGLASLGGVLLGIVTSVVLIRFAWDDEPGATPGAPTTTVDEFELAILITTPPTLPPVDPAPGTTTRPTLPTARPAAPPTTTLTRVGDELVGPRTYGTIPEYPRYSGIPDGGLDQFGLAAAADALGRDVARRSTTHFEVGMANNTIEVSIVRDPVDDRYGISLRAGIGVGQNIVIDVAGGLTYVTGDGEHWVTYQNSELISDVDVADLPRFFDRLMLGPVRPDTLAGGTVEPGPLVSLDDSIAREFLVRVPGASVPEWQLYAFSEISTLPDELRPETLEYLVYVDEQGELRRVLGTAAVADTSQLVIHQLETLTEREPVPLPVVESAG